MRLYLLEQDSNNSYDTFDECVVVAKGRDQARRTHPQGKEWYEDKNAWEGFGYETWASNLEDVTVTYIGKAKKGAVPSVVCASFNAG